MTTSRVTNSRKANFAVTVVVVVTLTSFLLGTGLLRSGDLAGPEAPAPSYAPVDDEALRLLNSTGTQVNVVQTSSVSSEAVTVASGAIGQTVGKRPSEVSLARVTVSDYARGATDSADLEGAQLLIEDRLVWVVIFDDFRNYYFGPAPSSGQSTTTRYDVVRLAVYVDADTTEVLRAETVG